MRRFPLAACAIALSAMWAADDEANIFIADVAGPAYLRTLDGGKIALTHNRHTGRRLHVGEAVQCLPGCTLKIHLHDNDKLPTVIPPNSTWVTILWQPTSAQTEQQNRNAAAARLYGRPGASEKAVRSAVYSPAGASVVQPSTFRIAWTRSAAPGTLSLAIVDEDGNELWRQNGIAGASGSLESTAARAALRSYRDGGGHGSLTLTFEPAGGRKAEVFFSLLAQAAEQEVDRQLQDWDLPATDLTRYLGRASVFAAHRMTNEETLEFEAALERAPESVDLIVRTIVAERRIGNVDRAGELERRLPPGTPIPE